MNHAYIPASVAPILDGPGFTGGACAGRADLFDERRPDEPAADVTHRHEAAAAICHTCPVLPECTYWVNGLTKRERPPGVVAAVIPPVTAQRGRPTKENPTA